MIDPLTKNKGPAFRLFEAFCREHLKKHQPVVHGYVEPHLVELRKIYGVQIKRVELRGSFKVAFAKAFDPLWANSFGVEGEEHIDALSAYVFGMTRGHSRQSSACETYSIRASGQRHNRKSLNY